PTDATLRVFLNDDLIYTGQAFGRRIAPASFEPENNVFGEGSQLRLDNIRLDETLCPGDLHGAGAVNFSDLSAVLNAFGSQNPLASADDDPLVNFADLNIILNNFGEVCPGF